MALAFSVLTFGSCCAVNTYKKQKKLVGKQFKKAGFGHGGGGISAIITHKNPQLTKEIKIILKKKLQETEQ